MAKGKAGKGKREAAAAANGAARQQQQQQESEGEDRPAVVRFLTVAAVSYIAHKIWTKRKAVTEAWYADGQSQAETAMVSAFEFFGSMGLIFAVGILVGLAFSKVAALVKRK